MTCVTIVTCLLDCRNHRICSSTVNFNQSTSCELKMVAARKFLNNAHHDFMNQLPHSLSLQKYQNFLDSLVPHKVPRWVVSVLLLVVYTIRVLILQGWYIVSYALAIYLLNLFIAFISPKFDPMMEEEEEIGELPTPHTQTGSQ